MTLVFSQCSTQSNASSRCRNLHDIFLISVVVDCGSLTAPANGQVDLTSGTTFGLNATYSCNTGYNLVGVSTRTCEATGVWPNSAPTCQGILFLSNMHLSNINKMYPSRGGWELVISDVRGVAISAT